MYTDFLSYRANYQPNKVAISLLKGEITYAGFESDINKVASKLASLVKPESVVVIAITYPYFHWLIVLALARLGHVTTSVIGPDSDGQIRAKRFGVGTVVISDKDLSLPGLETVVLSPEWLMETRSQAAASISRSTLNPSDAARIFFSSGTTGEPKRILLTHDLIIKRMGAPLDQVGPYHSCALIGPGIDTALGFIAALRTWLAGGTVCLLPPHPSHLQERQVTGLLVSPAQLLNIFRDLPEDFPMQPNLTIVVGGSALSRELNRSVRRRLTPNLIVAYGSTEAAAIARMPARMQDADASITGILLPWVNVQVVDDQDRTLAEGQSGQVRIKSDCSVDEYMDDPLTSASAFRNGWFYPGDIGTLSGRTLRIAGRADDIMNLGGVKALPDKAEQTLGACRGVEDIAVFSVRRPNNAEDPWCAIVRNVSFDEELFQKAATEHFKRKTNILFVNAIPRNAAGKVDRTQLRRVALKATQP